MGIQSTLGQSDPSIFDFVWFARNLFDTKQMLVNFDLAGMVPKEKDDEFGDLVEDFEKYKREAPWQPEKILRIKCPTHLYTTVASMGPKNI